MVIALKKNEYPVRRASRKLKRDLVKTLSNDFLKYLTEIILNADDSYKRLEQNTGDTSVKRIDIHLKRQKREVIVVDRAEGMDDDTMRDIFTEYGADRSGGGETDSIRGLFGQGASDVLFNGSYAKKKAEIMSFKDDVLYKCKFIMADKEQSIKLENPVTHKNNIRNLRNKFDVEGNGTIVHFGLPNKVSIPKKNMIGDKIERYYMLRYVLADPKREVVLHHDKQRRKLSSERFLCDKEPSLLKAKPVTIRYESHTIEGKLSLYKKTGKQDHTKVLIVDENNVVYDNTLFNLDEHPNAGHIKGVLVLPEIYRLLRDYLNTEPPEEILKDSRDGFDERHSFTKQLFERCKHHVHRQLERLETEKETPRESLKDITEINEALEAMNRYLRALELEEIGGLDPGEKPPQSGIAFARPKITITKDKQYALKLFINVDLIKPEEKIRIASTGEEHLEFHPDTISYTEGDENKNNLVTKHIHLHAKVPTESPFTLTAETGAYTSETSVSIVEADLPFPEYGLEFIPAQARIKPGKSHTLNLYADLGKYGIGTQVDVRMTSPQELIPREKSLSIKESHTIADPIACVPITFPAGTDGADYTVQATCRERTAEARVFIRSRPKQEEGVEDLFSDIEVGAKPAEDWQTFFDSVKGVITINRAHAINAAMFEDLTRESIRNGLLSSREKSYLMELIVNETARQITKRRVEKGFIENTFATTNEEFQRRKTELYKEVTKT